MRVYHNLQFVKTKYNYLRNTTERSEMKEGMTGFLFLSPAEHRISTLLIFCSPVEQKAFWEQRPHLSYSVPITGPSTQLDIQYIVIEWMSEWMKVFAIYQTLIIWFLSGAVVSHAVFWAGAFGGHSGRWSGGAPRDKPWALPLLEGLFGFQCIKILFGEDKWKAHLHYGICQPWAPL